MICITIYTDDLYQFFTNSMSIIVSMEEKSLNKLTHLFNFGYPDIFILSPKENYTV